MFQMFQWFSSCQKFMFSTVEFLPDLPSTADAQNRRTFCTSSTCLINKDFSENILEHSKNIWNIKDLQNNTVKTSTYKPHKK